MKEYVKTVIRFLLMPLKERSILESRRYGEKTIKKKPEVQSLLGERMYYSQDNKNIMKYIKET